MLEKAAGQRLSDLIASELWQPMGAEYDADITLDAHGNALADGGISATLRDAGRIGLLALRRGRADGRQVIAPHGSMTRSRAPPTARGRSRTATAPGPATLTGAHYRNCWWVIDPGLPLYCAAGVFGQSVFVHGRAELVVAKLSSWPVASSPPLRTAMVAAVRAIASALRRE